MDPIIVGFQPQRYGLAETESRLELVVAGAPSTAFRHWRGSSNVYLAMSGVTTVAELRGIAADVNARLAGAGRLVFDPDVEPIGDFPAFEGILRPDPGSDIYLPSVGPIVDAEILICSRCGGVGRHFYPPVH